MLENLRRYPESAISDINQRVDSAIRRQQVKRTLKELIEQEEVGFEGVNRW